MCSDFPDHKGITCDILSPDVSNAKTLQIRPEIRNLLRCAFAKLGIVTGYYKETCRRGDEISVPVKLINDTGADVSDLTVTLTVLSGDTVLYADKAVMSVEKFSSSNNGISSHTFKLTVPSYAGYCDNGKILYLVSSYTQNGMMVYSRRKLTVKGGGESVSDVLPVYDWLTEAPGTEPDTDTEPYTETGPEVSSAVDTDAAETEINTSENDHKVHPAVVAAIIAAAVAIASAAVLIIRNRVHR